MATKEENKTLADVKQALKDINKRAAERKAERDAERAKLNEVRRSKMNRKGGQAGAGGSIQGLNTSLGTKIVR